MTRASWLSTALLLTVSLSACVSPRSFVDPSQPKVAYEELSRREEPLKLKVLAEFQRNGTPIPKLDSIVKEDAEKVLRGTGIIIPVESGFTGTVKITVNNIADRGEAAAKGFGSGLTFGLVGTTVMDAYEMSIAISINDKTISRTAIKHALFSAVGRTSLPAGVEAVPPNVAFSRVLEQMILRALQDMQKAGEIASNSPIMPLNLGLLAKSLML